jgi:glutamate-1-semialdehyde 2,1-aminomutase
MREQYKFAESQRLWTEAQKYIPGGSQGTRQPEYPEYPIFFDRAKGCRMWDVDGNEYIDFLCSIGPILLGYAYKPVDDAVREIISTSFQSSMNHPVMIDVARLLTEMIPCAEGVRFMKTGTEATQLAVRLARNVTGRMHIARHGYHGWADMFIGHFSIRGSDKDASNKVHPFDGTAEGLDELLSKSKDEFAAVILCPADTRPFTHENYQGIIDVAHNHEALVIFDEIKSGFRVSAGGAQEYLGVVPDLTTVSKGIANGYPLSAIVGKSQYMDEMPGAGIAGTFSVEGLSLAAARATLTEIKTKNVVEQIHAMGGRFIDGLNEICRKHGRHEARAYGDPVPSMPRLQWKEGCIKGGAQYLDDEGFRHFFSELFKRGIFFSSWHVGFINFSHQEKDIDEALDICDCVMGMTAERFGE